MPNLNVTFNFIFTFCNVSGLEQDSLSTHGLLAGIINAGLNFGTAVGPAVTGTITQYFGFAWVTLFSSGIYTAMVRYLWQPIYVWFLILLGADRGILTTGSSPHFRCIEFFWHDQGFSNKQMRNNLTLHAKYTPPILM